MEIPGHSCVKKTRLKCYGAKIQITVDLVFTSFSYRLHVHVCFTNYFSRNIAWSWFIIVTQCSMDTACGSSYVPQVVMIMLKEIKSLWRAFKFKIKSHSNTFLPLVFFLFFLFFKISAATFGILLATCRHKIHVHVYFQIYL